MGKIIPRTNAPRPPVPGARRKLAGILVLGVTLALALAGGPGCGPCTPAYRKVSGVVTDESGRPVAGADVILHWYITRGLDPTKGSSEEKTEHLVSDQAGRFSGRGDGSYFDLRTHKEGYYVTSLGVSAGDPAENLQIPVKTIRHPQPMVGKKAKIRLPIGSTRLQYDFLAGDCLPPLGAGKVADLEIEWTRPADRFAPDAERNAFQSRVVGEGNGVILPSARLEKPVPTSKLRSLHEAPLEGYQPSCDFGHHTRGGELVAYVKIRSGAPGGPLYGKLRDPIHYEADVEADRFEFYYVINPSGDRGLEIDMKQITVPGRRELEYAPDEF